MYRIRFTPAEVLALAADLLADKSTKVGPRLTAAQKVVDLAREIIEPSDWAER